MKKIIAIIISVILTATFLTACGNNGQQPITDSTTDAVGTQQAQASTEESVFPMKIKDANGFEVTIEKEPTKIIPLNLGSAEVLFSVVDKSRIIAISDFADDPVVSNIADEAKEIKERASSASSEKIIAMGPDLVIVDNWTSADFIKQLRDAKITVYVFKLALNVDEQKKVITDLASIVGESAKGKELVDMMDKKLQEVNDKLKVLKPEDKLTILDYSEMGTTSGTGTNFDDIVTRAGMINIAAKEGLKEWPELSKEMVVKFNPDIINMPGWFYDKKNTADSFVNTLKGDKSLSDVKAIKNNKIIAIPYKHLSAVSQYMVYGVEDAAKLAYPELFK